MKEKKRKKITVHCNQKRAEIKSAFTLKDE